VNCENPTESHRNSLTGHRSLDTFRRYAIRDRGAQERALIARDAAKKAQAAQQAGPVVVPFARES
jgi:hypothetical protein